MNSFLLPLLFGVGVSPELVKQIQEEKKNSLEKWRVSLRFLLTTILGYIFFKRASIPATDSAGNAVYSQEGIQKSMNASFEENSFANWIKSMVLDALDLGFELLKPSTSEALMISALMNRTNSGGVTNVIQQQPTGGSIPIAAPAFGGGNSGNTMGNLRGARFGGSPLLRMQGAVIMPDGTIVSE
jgi:hypothetical protein